MIMNSLRINTTSADQTVVELLNGETVVDSSRRLRDQGTAAQVVLPMIEALLTSHHLQVSDISAVEVAEGPGSFTGTRVGIAIANSLGLALGVSVNDCPIGNFVQPIYAEQPKITQPK